MCRSESRFGPERAEVAAPWRLVGEWQRSSFPASRNSTPHTHQVLKNIYGMKESTISKKKGMQMEDGREKNKRMKSGSR